MSLIFGVCLPRRIYLVSDSRLSSSDGSFKDDFSKWLDINPRIGVVVANSAHQASWILKKLVKDVRRGVGFEWGFGDFEKYLRANLKGYATQYYAETGNLSHSVSMIFGGFNQDVRLVLESGRLGDVMANPIQKAGEGVTVTQTVDMDILNALRGQIEVAAQEGRVVSNGTKFEVDLPRPVVLAVTIKATPKGTQVDYEYAEPYYGIVFNPDYLTERVELPVDIIGELEYRNKGDEDREGGLYIDNAVIIRYVKQLVKTRGWSTVGGTIIPVLIEQDSSGIATGEYVYVDGEGVESRGGISSIDGKPHYYDESGKIKPYRFIYDYLDDTKSPDSHSKI